MGGVTNSLIDGTGRGLQDVTVRISLIAPLNPFLLNGTGEVIQRVAVDTDHNGVWTALGLLANDALEAQNTYWLVDESEAPGGLQWAIRMPEGDDTYNLRDLLIDAPPDGGTSPFSYSLDDLTDVDTSGEQPGDVLGYTSAGQWVPVQQQAPAAVFNVNQPITPWIWEHGLGRVPVVQVRNAQGEIPTVYVKVDETTVEVYPSFPMTGSIEAR